MLRDVVRKGVQDAVLRGKGADILIKQLQKEFKTSYNYARRLAVTETARVYSEAQKANYNANDIEEYQVLAEAGACDICAPFDGEHFKTSEMVAGHNAAPFHPHCRCTTAPYSERVKMWEKIEGEKGSVMELQEDVSKAFGTIVNNPNVARAELQSLFKESYNVGRLVSHPILENFGNSMVSITDHMLSYILTEHRGQVVEADFAFLPSLISSPDFLATDIRMGKDTFLLNAKSDKNRFLEATIMNKEGQTVVHFMRRDGKKNNKRLKKIVKKSKKHDFIDKKVYNIGEE
ncbi:Phage protein [Streptococcus sp. DD10]|nr:Phage protein [Streptococcus sp. DD10]